MSKRKNWRARRNDVTLREVYNDRGKVIAKFWLRRGQIGWRIYASRPGSGDWERAAAALVEITAFPHETAYYLIFSG